MPQRLYDFTCPKCSAKSEQWYDIDKPHLIECGDCPGTHLERCFPRPAFKMPRESQHGYDGNGAKVKFGKAGRYNPNTGEIDS